MDGNVAAALLTWSQDQRLMPAAALERDLVRRRAVAHEQANRAVSVRRDDKVRARGAPAPDAIRLDPRCPGDEKDVRAPVARSVSSLLVVIQPIPLRDERRGSDYDVAHALLRRCIKVDFERGYGDWDQHLSFPQRIERGHIPIRDGRRLPVGDDSNAAGP